MEDLEARAKSLLPKSSYDYFAGGAEDEATVRANREAFSSYRFRFRVLVASHQPDLSCELLGHQLSMPVQLAPVASQRLAHPEGELAAARAASEAGVVYCLSTLATASLEDVAAASRGPRWFQLYIYKDRAITIELVERASAAGYSAIVLTVDTPVLGRRERDFRNAFTLPVELSYENLKGKMSKADVAELGASGLAKYINDQLDPSLSWRDLEWLVGETPLPILLKGVVRGDDARKGVDSGARGIIVSNHGGRQLDYSVATLDALPEVAQAVASRVPVLMDGGARRGTDVLKALALGAKSVLIGRPYVWALATDGFEGVRRLLNHFRDELQVSMSLLGVRKLDELSEDLVVKG